MLGLAGCDPAPRDGEASAPTSTLAGRGTCAPTRGEPAGQGGTRVAPADAPSVVRLGPGGDVERTPETVAAGRGGQRLVGGDGVQPRLPDPARRGVGRGVADQRRGRVRARAGNQRRAGCYLAAALRTDQRGHYRFETVRPGHYKGEERPPPAHIHFEVRHPEAVRALTELLFEGDLWLGPDPPGAVVRLERVPGSDPPAMAARFDIVLRR